MGRPSLAEKRTAEILDAFECCVLRHGVEGSSLEKVAEEAGMKRSILRHYIGNRDDLIRALAIRVIARYESSFDAHLDATAEKPAVEQLLSYLFPGQPVSSTESILIIESLIAAGDQHPEIRDMMREYVDGLVGKAAGLLQQAYPDAGRRRCWAVAWGAVCICFNQESLTPLQLTSRYLSAARSCAGTLIESLARG